MGWKALIEAGWWPPYVACVWRGDRPAGSGLLIGPRHVLTMLHVLVDVPPQSAEARAASTSEPLPRPASGAHYEVSFANDLDRRLAGRFIDADRNEDIALIELERPLHGIARPRFAAPAQTSRARVVALGIQTEGEQRRPVFRHEAGTALLSSGPRAGRRSLQYGVDYGAQAGFSGGPVFLEDDGAVPQLIGLSRLGGDDLDHGSIVAADLVVHWLRGRFDDGGEIREPGDVGARLLARGYEPFHRIAVGADLAFAALDVPGRPERGPSFVALAPISRATRRVDGPGPDATDADRPAHFATAAEVAATLETLSRRHHVRFRLPSIDEIVRLQGLGAGHRAQPLFGEPLWNRHFVDAADAPLSPPQGVPEWCATQTETVVREHHDKGLRQPTVSLRRARMVARLAFDVEARA